MRIALIQNLYTNYISNFQVNFASQLTSYQESLALLQHDSFAWNGAWGGPMKEHGIEIVELYLNFDVLNDHWCRENGYDQKMAATDILIKQLKHFKVDAVINTDVNVLGTWFIKKLKEETGIKYVYAHICSPYFSYFDLTEYDGIFTCIHRFVELFRSYNKPTAYMPHCFNPDIIERVGPMINGEKVNKIFFAGGILRGQELHNEREKLLLAFIKSGIPMAFYSEIAHYNYLKGYVTVFGKKSIYYTIRSLKAIGVKESFINRIPLIKKGLPWEYLPGNTANRDLHRIASKPIYGLNFYSKMRACTVSLNIHAGVTKDEAANMRLFESTGMGTALLTDHKANLAEFFESDTEIVTFRSIGEAEEKAKYLLDNPDVSERIGAAGQRRILKDHTFRNRSVIVAQSIKNNFA
jgi:spore maturation protein CgeB